LPDAVRVVERAVGAEIWCYLAEEQIAGLEEQIAVRRKMLHRDAPFTLKHDCDTHLARFCYAVARATAPDAIVETGVAYGVTSAYLLQAVHMNSKGHLWSVDLPPLGPDADRYVGHLIPPNLRDRWHLHRGQTSRVLPTLLPSLAQLGMFVHDSLHTYRTIMNELSTVWPKLLSGAIVVADDIGGNDAFAEFTQRVEPAACVVVGEVSKPSMFGVLVKS
jgi:hypothetical protein